MLICGQLLEGNGYGIHACFFPSGFISYYSIWPFYSFRRPSLWVFGSSLYGEIPSLFPYLLFTGLANSSFSSQLKCYLFREAVCPRSIVPPSHMLPIILLSSCFISAEAFITIRNGLVNLHVYLFLSSVLAPLTGTCSSAWDAVPSSSHSLM